MAINLLLIYEDEDFYQSLLKSVDSNETNIYLAKDFKAANDYLEENRSTIGGVFINPNLSSQKAVEFMKQMLELAIVTPLYLVGPELDNFGKELLEQKDKLGIQGHIKESEEVGKIIEQIQADSLEFDFDKVVKDQEKVKLQEDDNEALEQGLIPIEARNFVCGRLSAFDVYVKIRKDKFIKILTAGDVFESERLNSYLSKGLTHLYIKREAQLHYLDFCDTLVTKLISSPNVKTEVKAEQAFNQGQEVVNFLRDMGINEENLIVAERFASNSYNLVKKLNSKDESVNKVLKAIVNFDHTAGTTLIAGLIAKELNIATQESHRVFGTACVLHDIGLNTLVDYYTHDPTIESFDEENVEVELRSDSTPMARLRQIEPLYKSHPELGHDMVSTIENIDPLIPQIILQHHDRIDGSGFPQKGNTANIHQLSQALGVADEFAKLLKLIADKKESPDKLKSFGAELKGFSTPVKKAFTKIFN